MKISIHTDGGSRGNPGNAAIGVVAQSSGEILFEISKNIGVATNNIAEYTAVLEALTHLQSNPPPLVSVEEVVFFFRLKACGGATKRTLQDEK